MLMALNVIALNACIYEAPDIFILFVYLNHHKNKSM